MKKAITLFLLFAAFLAQAQTAQKFTVYETQTAVTHDRSNQWKTRVPYKNYVRIVIAPYDVPANYDATRDGAIEEQVSEFIYKNHLDKFAKLKKHMEAYNYLELGYKESDYNYYIKPCTNCNWQYEIIIITGFKFVPRKPNSTAVGKYHILMHEFLLGKPWPQYLSPYTND